HKYDPIPSKDYYSLYGVFASSVEPKELPLIGTSEPSPARAAFEKELAVRQKKLADFLESKRGEGLTRFRGQTAEYLLAAAEGSRGSRGPGEINPQLVRRWQTYLAESRKRQDPIFAPWHAFAGLPSGEFAAKAPELVSRFATNSNPQQR